jgi:hypothetical protein
MNAPRTVRLALVAAATLLLGASTVHAQTPPLPPEQMAAFRADFNRLLDDFEDLAPLLESVNPRIGDQIDALAGARVHLDGLTDAELADLVVAVDRHPEVWTVPSTIREVLTSPVDGLPRALGMPPADLTTCGTDGQSSTCDTCPTNPFLIRDVFIAEAVSLTIEGIFEPIPDSLDIPLLFITITIPHPAKIIVGVLLYAAKAIALSFNATYFINNECLGRYQFRGVNYFADETVSSRASADSVKGLQQTIDDVKEEQLRLDVESHLTRRRTAISLFQLPQETVCSGESSRSCTTTADCSYCSDNTALACTGDGDCCSAGGSCTQVGACVPRGLQLVREIVREAIDDLRAAGQSVPSSADSNVRAADEAFGAEDWKGAYERYRKAYRTAVDARA